MDIFCTFGAEIGLLICPECGSIDLLFYEDGSVECLSCGFVYHP